MKPGQWEPPVRLGQLEKQELQVRPEKQEQQEPQELQELQVRPGQREQQEPPGPQERLGLQERLGPR